MEVGMSTCFFIGHRDAPVDVYSWIVSEVERLALQGLTEFVVGHYGAFDRMAARAVREVKRQHPAIRLILLLPYYETSTSKFGIGFDEIIYPEGQEVIPKRAAIIRANQYMIDNGDVLIMYARHIGSNTREFMDYAQRRFQRTGKPEIINLADWDNRCPYSIS
jgi:uncharacterized phage-like protein YoqJ